MQRCCSPHDEGVLTVSSTSSGRQLRKPDDHTCWSGEMVPPTDDKQQNADAAWRQLKRPEHSTSPGTGKCIHWDTGVPSRWAYTWMVSSSSGGGIKCRWDMKKTEILNQYLGISWNGTRQAHSYYGLLTVLYSIKLDHFQQSSATFNTRTAGQAIYLQQPRASIDASPPAVRFVLGAVSA